MTNTAAIPGLVQGATDIAGAYSQLISNHTVREQAARLLHSRHGLPGTLSATQIAQSPEILVVAKASTSKEAVALASAGSQALIDQVATLNATSRAQVNGLLQRYRQLEESISQEQQSIKSLNGQISASQGRVRSASNISSLQAQLASLEAQQSGNALEASALEVRYQNAIASLPTQEQGLTSVGPATRQGSDRGKALELAGGLGAAAGLLVFIAGAYLIEKRNSRRTRGPAGSAPEIQT